jgi:biopolymer transport protein ExbD
MLSTRTNPLKRITRIDVTAFASVMIVLAFTMLLVVMSENPFHHGVGPDLPKVESPIKMWGANRRDALMVAIMRDGKVFFGNDLVWPREKLAGQIRQRLTEAVEKKIYIRADARVPYGVVGQVLDSISVAGVERVGFLVDQRKAPTLVP